MCVQWYLLVIFICMSLMANDDEHLFRCLFSSCVSYLKKYLFKSFAHFLIRLFGFLLLLSLPLLRTFVITLGLM